MGLIKKIKSRANLRTIRLRRKSKSVASVAAVVAGAAAKPSTSTHDQKWELHVTSNPIEYTLDHGNPSWFIHKLDDFLSSFNEKDDLLSSFTENENSLSTGTDETDNYDAPAKPTADKYETGWGWFSQCWGSPHLTNKADDPTSESSYDDDDDGTGESSQPSLSRIDQVLELSLADDVSDITSIPSIDDDSDSDSENSLESANEIMQEES